ncbi:MAG: rhodanese-like domain-containing protein [Synechococcales cyanobacterium RM1_1_8]|nr:rhodanese-like domain-containing protein [Synechococcales cyanobacterium RM1_1_8]
MATTEQINGVPFEVFIPQEVNRIFQQNRIILIDVRTPQEYAFEYIPGAMLFPMASFDPEKLPSQNEKPIIFHCGSGRRSRIVAQQCADAGILQIAHMEGGLGAWKAAGYLYAAIDPATGGYIQRPSGTEGQ